MNAAKCPVCCCWSCLTKWTCYVFTTLASIISTHVHRFTVPLTNIIRPMCHWLTEVSKMSNLLSTRCVLLGSKCSLMGELTTLPRPPSRLGRGNSLPIPLPLDAFSVSALSPSTTKSWLRLWLHAIIESSNALIYRLRPQIVNCELFQAHGGKCAVHIPGQTTYSASSSTERTRRVGPYE